MRTLAAMVLTYGFLAAASLAEAQGPPGLREGPPESADDFVTRIMAFDANKDGTLTKAEVTDARLQRLFDRADANKDGTATKEELTALFAQETPPAGGPRGGGGPGGRGPGGFGGPGGGGPGGGGPGGFGGPPRPGQVLPDFLQDQLELTDEQKTQVAELQKDVDARLEKILTAEQRAQLREMRQRGPGGPGGFGGGPPGGPGRPGGGGPPRPPGGPPPPPEGPQ
jgi:hypothetical protein